MRRISWLSLAAASAALAPLALGASSASGGPASASHRCGGGLVHAVVAGRHRCLREGVICRPRFNAAYHRYLFHCYENYLVFWWSGLTRRPLHIPTLAPGTECPAADERRNVRAVTPAFGPGPAYPTLSSASGRAHLRYLVNWGYEGWHGTKVLWTVPDYVGPYIVRGRQLDGPNELRFDQGPNWSRKMNPELRLVGPFKSLNPAATYLRGPGCYAYQVDGRGFSYLIVFEAQPAS